MLGLSDDIYGVSSMANDYSRLDCLDKLKNKIKKTDYTIGTDR